MNSPFLPSRRRMLAGALSGLGAVALASLRASEAQSVSAARAGPRPPGPDFTPRAKRVVWLFMAGGPSQLDLFDYKPDLASRLGEELPESIRNGQRLTTMSSGARLTIAPSPFSFARGGHSGAWVSDLLPNTREIVDDLAIVRTVHTESINHEPAILTMNTGSLQPGKASVGAWLSYGLGRLTDDLPTYDVMTSRFTADENTQALSARLGGSGVLSAEHAGVSLRGAGDPVLYLTNPPGVDLAARRGMLDAISALNGLEAARHGDRATTDRTAQYERAFLMQSAVPELVDLSGESSATYALYGDAAREPGTFAANCLLARRMLERGVRFVQIFHRGWDQHQNLVERHPLQCRDVDQGAAALVTDLKQRGLLEDTLVVWGGEFGRTVYSQGDVTGDSYGRDHHGRCFSMWLAGGGIRPGVVHGETDDFGYNVVDGGVHVRDLHATILNRVGLDHDELSVPAGGLEARLVGVDDPALPVRELLL
jgi:uncharacterized protein (DUF1501 family)